MNFTDRFEFIKDKPARNRAVMAPMDTLMATNGFANDFHIQHYGARAYGGVGTIIVESTAVAENGRIREKDLGIWSDSHIEGLQRIVNISKQANAIIGIQLNHAGAKAEVAMPIIGATKFYDYLNQEQLKIASHDDLQIIKQQFVDAAKRAKLAGFDFVELHAAHGYFLSELIHSKLNDVIKSPDIITRSQLLIDIVNDIYDVVQIPVGIRVSFTDHAEGGMELAEYQPLVELLNEKVSYWHVSSGETIARVRMADVIADLGTKLFRLPIAATVKKWTTKPVVVVGNFDSIADVNEALVNNIDAIAFGRSLLYNPNFVITNLLKVDEIKQTDYHWNQNLWFDYHDYKNLITNIIK
ncbi:NADPH dehydrogenase [Spiroplasma sp. DGKH1]|uniref:oxidoreductase n=1 Tax=Spiroplasma sp. DGKH1 TaxID=3050074 RepID=UPI0034C6B529